MTEEVYKKLNENVESQQELHCAQAEELQRRDQQLLHERLLHQNLELRAAHHESLNEMEELSQDTFLELSGRIQELQNEINCINDSREFQDAESVRSGHSHVASQRVSFPPHAILGGMLSSSIGMPSRREGPPSIWDTHGIWGNVFCKSSRVLFSSSSARIESMEFRNVRTNSFIGFLLRKECRHPS